MLILVLNVIRLFKIIIKTHIRQKHYDVLGKEVLRILKKYKHYKSTSILQKYYFDVTDTITT